MISFKQHNNFYVITGGPGVGKTTLLTELQNRGYPVVPEIARQLIKEQQHANGDALPWKNKERYKQLMFDRSVESYANTEKKDHQDQPVFFDRSFLDPLCYAQLIDSPISQEMQSYAQNWKYNPKVFMLPPWQEIYQTDAERQQDWEEVLLTHSKMKETYTNYGYQIIEVPKTTPKTRADFVLEGIGV
ncbi:AAA family ATPase [Zunongwangia pacifica]|uniref:AAA family ATPase n=1 Tax=Zunongwangia pacifica TaxID=2911062 RepID=A0A9X2CR11_9FLAO|nr:AAA family ATPase [Zunongwangia pacifica]MCL6220698.1 AAA family ATPase [Zunongwangia pacifica]